MTDEEVEKIIKQNMNLTMNLAGIRADFEAAQQRTWVGLTNEDWNSTAYDTKFRAGAEWAEDKLKEKNT